MAYPNNSNTEFAIKSERMRYLWASWNFFLMITCLIGDSTILFASIKHKAIKLHGAIVAFIQHVAVSNILISGTLLLPIAVSLITDDWKFGPVFCYITPYLKYQAFDAGRLLICGMTVCKLLILKYPLRSANWSSGHAHLACAFIWCLCLFWPVSFLLVKGDDEAFDYRLYSCMYQTSDSVWKNILPVEDAVAFGILCFIPNFIVVVATAMILFVARRVATELRRGLKWQGVLTVVLTAVVYSLVFLPSSVYYIYSSKVESTQSKPDPISVNFYRIETSIESVHVITNFFIYCLTVDSFRTFLRVRVQWLTSCFFINIQVGAMTEQPI
jgi:hypothetical protein